MYTENDQGADRGWATRDKEDVPASDVVDIRVLDSNRFRTSGEKELFMTRLDSRNAVASSMSLSRRRFVAGAMAMGLSPYLAAIQQTYDEQRAAS